LSGRTASRWPAPSPSASRRLGRGDGAAFEGILRRGKPGTRAAGPAEYVVGAVRALELFAPSPSTVFLADWSARLGQDLFAPPNVGGWPGGRVWVSAQASIARANYAAVLVGGRLSRGGQPLDALGLARKHGRGKSLDDLSASGLADRVAVMAFSEFGRTVAENFSAGTDHGNRRPRVRPGPQVDEAYARAWLRVEIQKN